MSLVLQLLHYCNEKTHLHSCNIKPHFLKQRVKQYCVGDGLNTKVQSETKRAPSVHHTGWFFVCLVCCCCCRRCFNAVSSVLLHTLFTLLKVLAIETPPFSRVSEIWGRLDPLDFLHLHNDLVSSRRLGIGSSERNASIRIHPLF